jgi:hypothetical protein
MKFKVKQFADWREIPTLEGVWRIKKVPGLIKKGQAVYYYYPDEAVEFQGMTTDSSFGEHVGWAIETSSGDVIDVYLVPGKKTSQDWDYPENSSDYLGEKK